MSEKRAFSSIVDDFFEAGARDELLITPPSFDANQEPIQTLDTSKLIYKKRNALKEKRIREERELRNSNRTLLMARSDQFVRAKYKQYLKQQTQYGGS